VPGFKCAAPGNADSRLAVGSEGKSGIWESTDLLLVGDPGSSPLPDDVVDNRCNLGLPSPYLFPLSSFEELEYKSCTDTAGTLESDSRLVVIGRGRQERDDDVD
jgi:hypothetical protein